MAFRNSFDDPQGSFTFWKIRSVKLVSAEQRALPAGGTSCVSRSPSASCQQWLETLAYSDTGDLTQLQEAQ
ncbi:MbtH family protein [Shigella flexneri]